MKIDIEYIEQLVKLFKENELTELSVEEGDKAIVLRKEKEVLAASIAPMPAVQHAAAAPVSTPVAEASKAEAPQDKGVAVTSPMVGTFYKASSPGSPAFTEVGKTISTGQVVCIIEAMKLMNEIESEVSGTVTEICVQDGQPVEYGQVLMYVKP